MPDVTQSATSTTKNERTAIGSLIRFRRKELGMPQTKLAEELGLTFQQVQKYEKATNRVAADRLIRIAEVLKVPITYFFAPANHADIAGLHATETLELIAAMNNLPKSRREEVVRLARLLVQHDGATIIALSHKATTEGSQNGDH